MKIAILGAGLSGISTAYFLQKHEEVEEILIIEKEDSIGGLCKTIKKGKYMYDIGPHIIFSKDKEILDFMNSILEEKNNLKRSNKILYKGIQVQYPFENDLSKLPKNDLKYCIDSFNTNPYENYEVSNMLQFFLKTFGEGITNSYLRPYNEKIWKYDPAFMNTSMVERIPKPTKDEIRRSAGGETIDGYVHQLYFTYPKNGGIESLINAFKKRLSDKCKIALNSKVEEIRKNNKRYIVKTKNNIEYSSDLVISTIPVQELTNTFVGSDCIKRCSDNLRYNSIAIYFIKTPYDLCGNNFAFMIPDKDVIFHRISKMGFLGDSYSFENEANYMIEITYRHGDMFYNMSDDEISKRISDGMVSIGFAKKREDVEIIDSNRQKYAYVIYDLNHNRNMSSIREFYNDNGILLNGRFGNFEYWNTDKVIRESLELSRRIFNN